jgi:hexosaminidase
MRSLLNVSEAYKLEVIPLVQTFGHLEYALKLPQFSHLRENPAVPQAVCPSQNESFVLIQNLVDQVREHLAPFLNLLFTLFFFCVHSLGTDYVNARRNQVSAYRM